MVSSFRLYENKYSKKNSSPVKMMKYTGSFFIKYS